MKVGIVVAKGMGHQEVHAEALSIGLSRHGVTANTYTEAHGFVPPEEVCACWGWRIGQQLRQAGRNVLVMERGFVDRMSWTSFGWNGLNGRATRNWDALPARWAVLSDRVRAWRPNGSYVLLIGQVTGDMSVSHVNLSAWYLEAIEALHPLGLPVLFRPHPVALEYGQHDDVPCDRVFGDLASALDGAAVVATFNSNTGVDALLAGKPTIARDPGSMAWPIAARDWSIQSEPDRLEWFKRLTSSQFSLDEIRSGFAWDVVKDSPTLQ